MEHRIEQDGRLTLTMTRQEAHTIEYLVAATLHHDGVYVTEAGDGAQFDAALVGLQAALRAEWQSRQTPPAPAAAPPPAAPEGKQGAKVAARRRKWVVTVWCENDHTQDEWDTFVVLATDEDEAIRLAEEKNTGVWFGYEARRYEGGSWEKGLEVRS